MRHLKHICYIFVTTLCVASAVTTKSKVKEASTDEITSNTEFSTRLGVHGDKKESNNDNFKPSVSFGERRKNSSAAASEKSPQISYPDHTADEKSVNSEDSPQPVVLKLLDEKENNDSPTPHKEDTEENYEGRARFPKIYYGEVSPPYPAHEDEQSEQAGPRHIPDKPQEDEPKYYYPKYANKQTGNKKKRYEYKHEEQRHASEHHHEPRHHGSHESSQALPEKLEHQHEPDYRHDGYRSEGHNEHQYNDHHGHGNSYGHDLGGQHENEHGYGHYPDHSQHQGHKYRHGHGTDVIGKALSVLIPSALLLTGVSALFPNRLHVPTNDYNTYNRRQKRSIDYNGGTGSTSQMLGREHRSLDIGIPESNEYNNFINGNMGGYGDYMPSMYSDRSSLSNEMINNLNLNQFDIIPISNHQNYPTSKADSYGQKTPDAKHNDLPFIRRPSTPQEYDQYNYGPQSNSNDYASPERVYEIPQAQDQSVSPTLATQEISTTDSESMGSVPAPTATTDLPKKKQRRVRVRTGIRKKIRSRPLPTSSAQPLVPLQVQEFQRIPENEPQIRQETLAARESKKLEDLVSSFKAIQEPTNSYLKGFEQNIQAKPVDLSPDGPVMGLITSYAQHDRDSPACQKRALCELAMKGSQPTASKFESFLWSLATLVPDQFSKMYELEDIFKSIKTGDCRAFPCSAPNLDIQSS